MRKLIVWIIVGIVGIAGLVYQMQEQYSGLPLSFTKVAITEQDELTMADIVSTDLMEMITKERAVEIVINKLPYVSAEAPTQFGHLEYNGTRNGEPAFVLYQADANSMKIMNVTYSSIAFNFYTTDIKDVKTDRFVWVVTGSCEPGCDMYFVDAGSEEFIGIWNTCPWCICHHNNESKK